MPVRRRLLACLASAIVLASSPDAIAQHPDGAALVRLMGSRAMKVFAPPGATGMGALVTLPSGTNASDVGLTQAAPGFARLWGSRSEEHTSELQSRVDLVCR